MLAPRTLLRYVDAPETAIQLASLFRFVPGQIAEAAAGALAAAGCRQTR
jgi:hypothetical protein